MREYVKLVIFGLHFSVVKTYLELKQNCLYSQTAIHSASHTVWNYNRHQDAFVKHGYWEKILSEKYWYSKQSVKDNAKYVVNVYFVRQQQQQQQQQELERGVKKERRNKWTAVKHKGLLTYVVWP